MNCVENLPQAKLEALRNLFNLTAGMLAFDEAALLYTLAKSVSHGCIVEIGSYRGLSTLFLAHGSLDGACVPVYAVDPHRDFHGVLGGVFGPGDRTAFFQAMLKGECSQIVSLINLSCEQFTDSWTLPVSLLWIDGDHSYIGVRRDFECWLPHVEHDAVIVFHDAIDTSLGPRKLINELLASSRFEEVLSLNNIVMIRRLDSRSTE